MPHGKTLSTYFSDKTIKPKFPVVIKNESSSIKCYDVSFGHFGWCGTDGDNSTGQVGHDENWGFCSADCNQL